MGRMPHRGFRTIGGHIVTASLLSSMLIAMPARAAQGTASFPVSMTVQKVCSFIATVMDFGVYTGALLNGTGTVTVTCTNTTPFEVGIDAGMNNGGYAFNWEMVGPGGVLLPYQVYTDSAHTIRWGGSTGYDTVTGSGKGAPQVFTAYGQIQAGHFFTPGAYTDTITFSLYY
jgi:spore coat protein U-like protein